MTGVVWVLNLDADLELAACDPRKPHSRYQPTDAVRAQVARMRPAARALLDAADVTVADLTVGGGDRADGRLGKAWCMTPSARAALCAVGAEPVPSPPVAVVRAVNDRAFCASLGQTLEGARFVTTEEEALAYLSAARETTLAKRAFGMSGRGQRRIGPGPLSPPDWSWIRASLREGGLQLEPLVPLQVELGQHGEVSPNGAVRLGRPVVQTCSEQGVWLASRPAGPSELVSGDVRALQSEAERVGHALWRAGYFGPFGVDAFLYGDPPRLNPRSEINARYSMGWPAAW